MASLPDDVIRVLVQTTGEAFRAGWAARERQQQAEGEQRSLLPEE